MTFLECSVYIFPLFTFLSRIHLSVVKVKCQIRVNCGMNAVNLSSQFFQTAFQQQDLPEEYSFFQKFSKV